MGRVRLIGMGADGPAGLSAGAREVIASADFVAGGRRHLSLVRTMGGTGASSASDDVSRSTVIGSATQNWGA